MLDGLDLSGWQRSTPSLAGMSFLWAKATEGTGFADPMYASHTAAAKAAGIVHGAYHFGHTGIDPAAQARFLVAHAPDAQLYALDSEGASRMTHAEAAAFIAAVKAARPGVKVGLYESLSGYDRGAGQDFNWVAAWRATAPPIPWTFWQHTSSGAVAGYTGHLDLDRFNGDLASLHRLAGIAAPTATPPPAKAFHTVVRGDTLSGIAAAHHLTLARLLAFPENKRFRANPSLIHPGDRVRVK
jgi:GH25 family lysozyme M1 (1,4-beta-N-acetylmuramidase)